MLSLADDSVITILHQMQHRKKKVCLMLVNQNTFSPVVDILRAELDFSSSSLSVDD